MEKDILDYFKRTKKEIAAEKQRHKEIEEAIARSRKTREDYEKLLARKKTKSDPEVE